MFKAIEQIVFKSTFKISKMDCPSEEQIIRIKLEQHPEVESLDFDIPNRKLAVYHRGGYESISASLDGLMLDSRVLSTEQIISDRAEKKEIRQRRVLFQVLLINLFFFVLEMITGFIAGSMGLVADSLDMLADSIVYGLSFFAVGGTISKKKAIAKIAGYLQILLAILGFAEVVRRFLGHEAIPSFQIMVFISLLALTGNAICLYLLQKSKSTEAHMQASMIFTSNDVIVNIGVIVAGILVYLTSSKLPDLVVGALVFVLVGKGAYRILQLSK